MDDHDLLLAQQLQEEFDRESVEILTTKDKEISKHESGRSSLVPTRFDSGLGRLSVIDPSLETVDPNPDVRALFLQFNDHYFWGKLSGVEVRWSPRMTLCAGICHYEGRGGLCSIRLSVPLLKLRPRKDLVETLLHEMIHAFLFVTDNDRDHDGHGPNFQKHMHRINKASGAKITIYHNFHDEVDNYRQHWWQCDGPCRNRRPYYGWVKRAMNRAPSANDPWWEDHVRSCGGTYIKVKEPEGYGVKKKDIKEKKDLDKLKGTNKDIRSFLGKGKALGSASQNKSSTSGSNKVASTVTSSGGQSSSSSSATDGAPPNNVSNFSVVTNDWGGGIWAPEQNVRPQTTSNINLKNNDGAHNSGNVHDLHVPSREASSNSSHQKNWTVVETKNDKEIKLKSGSSDSLPSQNADNKGNVLGGGSGVGQSWLARMRKQWAEESRTSRPAASSHTTGSARVSNQNNVVKGQESTGLHSDEDCTENKSESETTPAQSESDVPGRYISLSSEDSHHSSFHVSSCEEDNWPTPEKRRSKKVGSGNKLKRKRTHVDIISSDEEDFDLCIISKRAATNASLSVNDSHSDSHFNIFQQMKAKALSKDDRDSEKGTAGHRDTVFSGKARDAFENWKHQSNDNICGGHGSTSEIDLSTSSSEANASGSSGALSNSLEDFVSMVSCPVCQTEMPADNINVHLDSCLS